MNDTKQVAKDLLGKTLVRKIGSKILSGIITETEAYKGKNDPASHASRKKHVLIAIDDQQLFF